MEIYHVYVEHLGWKKFNEKCTQVKFLDIWKCFEFLDEKDHRLAIVPRSRVVEIDVVNEIEQKTVKLNPHF